MPSRISNAWTVAAVSASAALVISEVVRRLLFGTQKKEAEQDDYGEESYGEEPLPELGQSLRKREYSFPSTVYPMNNGSYGGVPQRILTVQKRMIEERERCPELWYRFRAKDAYKAAVKVVAEYVNARPENLVLVENVTTATNAILKSFKFKAGDQVLVSNHTYDAVVTTLELVLEQNPDVRLLRVATPFQTTVKEIIDTYTTALEENPRIRLVLLDHITSSSAILMPITQLVEICHGHDAIVAIDGAHGPGQVPLSLEELGADFYFGNLHKWLFSPRGCALFYVHPKHHSWIRTPISSHETFDLALQDRFHCIGTRDNIPYYMAKHSIQFLNYLGGLERITAHNTELAYWAADMLAAAWNTSWIKLEPELRAPFMCLVVLPQTPKLALYDPTRGGTAKLMYDVSKQGCYVAITTDGKQIYLRISAQVYNFREEYYCMRDAIKEVLGMTD